MIGHQYQVSSEYNKKVAIDPRILPLTIDIYRESVDFVLDELKKMERGSSNLVIDGHFMPYTRYNKILLFLIEVKF